MRRADIVVTIDVSCLNYQRDTVKYAQEFPASMLTQYVEISSCGNSIRARVKYSVPMEAFHPNKNTKVLSRIPYASYFMLLASVSLKAIEEVIKTKNALASTRRPNKTG